MSWDRAFPEKVVLRDLDRICPTWHEIFRRIFEDEYFEEVEDFLTMNKKRVIYPNPENVFSCFNKTRLDNVKVVILGQDPYINEINGIPQATGLSFSVPDGFPIPVSLLNIFKNMVKFGHLKTLPKSGNLEYLAAQGCLMLNTAFTVFEKESNSHGHMWQWVSTNIIKYISEKCDFVIFVLWGAPAESKKKYIDKKHKLIISSHPSGLSCNKPLRTYPAFMDNDHFGQINTLLIERGLKPIIYEDSVVFDTTGTS